MWLFDTETSSPTTVGGGMVLVMHNHDHLTQTLKPAAGFLPDVPQNSVLIRWRENASKKMRVPKLSALRSWCE